MGTEMGACRGAGGDCTLAARVRMSAGCAVLWEEEGWRVRVLLEWQRLVNGGRVMAKRNGTVGVTGAHLQMRTQNAVHNTCGPMNTRLAQAAAATL